MIILVRHGETFWNRERRIQGRMESELTPLGERQAKAMAGLVADLIRREAGPWRLASSPIGRARQTAQAIADATGLPIELEDRLAEICCGDWEGHLWPDIIRDHLQGVSAQERFFGAPGGGESYDDVIGRARDFLASLPPEPDRRVIAVSHGALGRLLRGAYAGLDRETINAQDVPQDAVYVLADGRIEKHACEPVEAA